ncbi:eukaryotic translation initiation factor 4E-like [Varroa jacobsoni]|uniref:Eukaryotic translation initiation factor 4E n=1 Tax=Varroa destructor TaxID=109461 RepID=A0A7M7K488_VARDE|nr:eukaryotic translation initiation factor 4E-like [Varroa destructor]XP_022700487.1 eukaryotic translation initiation factor 4E-like [Varroa jacobsoni]
MAKKKSLKKNKRQKSTIMEVPTIMPDVDNLPHMPTNMDQLVPSVKREEPDLTLEFDDCGFTATPDLEYITDDDVVVPSSPPPIKHHHDGSGDSILQNRFIIKEAIVPPRYNNEVATGISVSFKDISESGRDQTTEAEKTYSFKESASEACTKHPLQDVWVFWYYQGDKKKSWQENLLRLWEFDTVEDFWAMYNHTIQPSNLQPGRDFNLFKKGIRPEWEDVHNTGGGMWSITLRERRTRSPEMDAVWTEVAMLLIGDQFDNLAPSVNGATYSARKNQDRVSLWVKADFDRHRDEIRAIGERLRKAVQFAGNNFVLEYATSDDWKYKAGPTVNARIILHLQ